MACALRRPGAVGWGPDRAGPGGVRRPGAARRGDRLRRCGDPPGRGEPGAGRRRDRAGQPVAGRAAGRLVRAHRAGHPGGVRQLDPLAGRLGVRGGQAPRGVDPRRVGGALRGAGRGRRDAQHLRRARGAALQLGDRHVQPPDRPRGVPDAGRRQGAAAGARPAGRRRAARPGAGADVRLAARGGHAADGQRRAGPAAGDRCGLPHGRPARPRRPVHPRPVQHLPGGHVPRAVADPPAGELRRPRRAGRDGQGRRRADPGVLLLDQPRLHPRPALAPPQGRAVPGAARAGRDPAAQAVHRRGGHVPGQRRAAGDHRHAHDVGPLDHQHRPRRADHPVLRRRDLRPRPARHLSPRRSES